jgi:hypothetical protein
MECRIVTKKMIPVMRSDDDCCGFILCRNGGAIAGYDRDARPLGVFTTEEAAARAVLAAAESGQDG